jgi:hypothetical protein
MRPLHKTCLFQVSVVKSGPDAYVLCVSGTQFAPKFASKFEKLDTAGIMFRFYPHARMRIPGAKELSP